MRGPARSLLKLFLIFVASSFDVRVRAARIEEPKQCLNQNVECAIYTSSGVTTFKTNGGEVRLSAGASVVKKAPDVLRVITGNVLVKARADKFRIEGLFGQIEVKDGAVLIEASSELMKVTNLSGDVRYKPRGQDASLDLPKGLMNEMGRVGTDGHATSGYPRSMSLRPLVETWSKFFKKHEFKTLQGDFEGFLPHWRAGLDFVGPWYRDTVMREIAEHQAELERRRRLREVQLREENYYREMFRRKNFLD